MRIGRGGQHLIAQVTGLNRHTIARGCRELRSDLQDRPLERVRRAGGGRLAAEARDPALPGVLEALLESETAGDPMGMRAKAKRSSLAHLSAKLAAAGHPASRPTVSRLLRKLEYSPKVNARRREARSPPAERNAQFEHIAAESAAFAATSDPIISVDTKKKEHRVLCQAVRVRYAFIKVQSKSHAVRTLCQMMQVHPSGYYAWCQQAEWSCPGKWCRKLIS